MAEIPSWTIRQHERDERVVAVTVLHDAMDVLLNVDADMHERSEAAALLAGAMGHQWPPYPVDEDGEPREDWPCYCVRPGAPATRPLDEGDAP